METDGMTITTNTYSLKEVLQSIQSVLLKTYANRQFWIRCELSRISLHVQSGHCYLELIDKNETSIVAQMRGIIWADKYNIITEKFRAVTNTALAGGMKVLFQCSINFHPVHGISLTITDIEPTFTLGEMARMKNESIARLKSEGLFNLNRNVRLALVPKRIALISVATSRGYQDFMTTIQNHQYPYSINCRLFDAVLQGENAVPTLIHAMKQIIKLKDRFDAIAIIRGGAGDAGLSCYDEYILSAIIANSPLPVITGIGHASNETVVEMIAYKNCITPTAAATFILSKFDDQLLFLTEQSVCIIEMAKDFFQDNKNSISALSQRFHLIVRNHLDRENYFLKSTLSGYKAHLEKFFALSNEQLKQKIKSVLNSNKSGQAATLLQELKRKLTEIKHLSENRLTALRNNLSENKFTLTSTTHRLKIDLEGLKHLTEKVMLLDPANTLRRGYSITRLNGKAISDAGEVRPGLQLETELAEGIIISTVEKEKKYGKEKNV